MNFEYIFKRFDEDYKELQLKEVTSLDKKGQDSIFYYILIFHFVSIVMCNIIIEYDIKSVMIIEYLVLSSSYILHAC